MRILDNSTLIDLKNIEQTASVITLISLYFKIIPGNGSYNGK